MKITKKRLEEIVKRSIRVIGESFDEDEFIDILKQSLHLNWEEMAHFEIYDDFNISIYKVESYHYENHRELMHFYDLNSHTISTIEFSLNDWKKIENKSEVYKWNYLANLFSDK